MVSEYLTVFGETENTTVIERSKFICYIKGVDDEEDAKNFIDKIKKQNSLATHNCYAYIADELGLKQKFSDDGEPQGTAGMPMLDVLKNKKIYKTCVVVTRYFGGVKLGTGGLVRAYGGAVIDGLEKADIVNMQLVKTYEIWSDYDSYSKLLKTISIPQIVVKETNFSDKVRLVVGVKEDFENAFLEKLSDIFKGSPQVRFIDTSYNAFR